MRTLQRWERNGVPVRRVNHSLRSPVVADSDELDAWILHRGKLPLGVPDSLLYNLERAREGSAPKQKRASAQIDNSQEGVSRVSGKEKEVIAERKTPFFRTSSKCILWPTLGPWHE